LGASKKLFLGRGDGGGYQRKELKGHSNQTTNSANKKKTKIKKNPPEMREAGETQGET